QNVSAASTGLTDISFTLPKDEGRKAIDALDRGGPPRRRSRDAGRPAHHRSAAPRRTGEGAGSRGP
ncbi:hypothetical protein, partial [Streptomyces sp. NPDC003032]